MRRNKRRGRFIGLHGQGLGALRTRLSHRLRTYLLISLTLLACWLVMVPGYIWIMEADHSVTGTLRWTVATLLDLVGLENWRWTVETDVGDQRWRSEAIRYDIWHLAQVETVVASLWIGVGVSTALTIPLGLVMFGWFEKKGRDVGESRFIRGRQMTSDKKIAARIKRKGLASELTIGKVPLIKNKEAYNILLLGAQGTGKTSATEALLEGIQARGEPAVIYDFGPSLLQRFFDAERGDILLNPLDDRSVVWSPWSEIETTADCTAIAEAFIPFDKDPQQFWGNAGRLLFADILDSLSKDPDRSAAKLLHTLLRLSREEMRRVLENKNAGKLFEDGAERTGTNVEIHNSIYVKALGLLEAKAGGAGDFSITQYVQALDRPAPSSGRPWLWLTADPKSLVSLKPLLSCWTNAVATALLSLPERLDRRLWFVLDELATLHELPALPRFQQNARKRGGCSVITLQTPAQLWASYNDADAQTILNGCQTQAIFRLTDARGAAWASESIGKAEVEELRESARLSTSGHHDVHLSVDKQIRPVLLPEEIALLQDGHCYVKLPDDWPVAKTVVDPRSQRSPDDEVPGFIKRSDESTTADKALEGVKDTELTDLGGGDKGQEPASPKTAKAGANSTRNQPAKTKRKPANNQTPRSNGRPTEDAKPPDLVDRMAKREAWKKQEQPRDHKGWGSNQC